MNRSQNFLFYSNSVGSLASELMICRDPVHAERAGSVCAKRAWGTDEDIAAGATDTGDRETANSCQVNLPGDRIDRCAIDIFAVIGTESNVGTIEIQGPCAAGV